MGQGISGSFAVNGTNFLLPPTEYGWVTRDLIGVSGNAHPVYPAVRQFEMTWGFMDMASYAQLEGFYTAIQSTGTVVIDLPKFSTTPFQFQSYTGCTLKEPEVSKFFEQHVSGVNLLVIKIKTI